MREHIFHILCTLASKQPLPIWKELANELFNETQNELQRKKGLYDKLIMECSFKSDRLSKGVFELDGGCDQFNPTLTTNGLCYTFNGQTTSNVWKSQEIIQTFDRVFPSIPSSELFRDIGRIYGKFVS